jgi:asparagine synthase (glutamine-hydrolysing)
MCGITGAVEASASTPADALTARIDAMADTLTHRGPDDRGVWIDAESGVGLGFRRLAIIDLTPTGHQPMTSADGRYVLVFNGEVYNYAELRPELEAAGVRFRGRSDTEVLLEAFSAWGPQRALERANGMFALACWDRRDRTLLLARDRFGEKPLYYGWIGSTFLFGSELKALHAHPAFTASIDRDALALYFRYSCVPAPHSIYRGIAKLPPASLLRVNPAHRDQFLAPTPYWSADEAAAGAERRAPTGSGREVADAVEAALRRSVGLRMVADVPVGAFLSGGTDSSLVVALMQQQSTAAVRTFTIGFETSGYDEAARARAVAQHLGTEHTELYVTPDETRSVIPQLPCVYDEPFADSSQIPTMLVNALARREVTVALSGEGGDELFGGYTRYAALTGLQRWERLPRPMRRGIAAAIQSQSPGRWDSVARRASSVLPGRRVPAQPGDKLHKLAGALTVPEPAHLYRSLVECWPVPPVLGAHEPATVVDRALSRSASGSDVEGAMLVDTLTYLPDDLLTKVDRASMAVSLEARVPMLDPDLFTVAWQLPIEARVAHGTGKHVLLDVLSRHLPADLVGGPKRGFALPFGDWLRDPLRPWAESLLDEQRLDEQGYLDTARVRQAWDEHVTGRRDRRHQLWAVLMFEAWLETAAP